MIVSGVKAEQLSPKKTGRFSFDEFKKSKTLKQTFSDLWNIFFSCFHRLWPCEWIKTLHCTVKGTRVLSFNRITGRESYISYSAKHDGRQRNHSFPIAHTIKYRDGGISIIAKGGDYQSNASIYFTAYGSCSKIIISGCGASVEFVSKGYVCFFEKQSHCRITRFGSNGSPLVA